MIQISSTPLLVQTYSSFTLAGDVISDQWQLIICYLQGGYRTITVEKEGFEDVVLVNPGPSDEESSFVCLGAGNFRTITLAPGESWEGRQTVRLEK